MFTEAIDHRESINHSRIAAFPLRTSSNKTQIKIIPVTSTLQGYGYNHQADPDAPSSGRASASPA